MEITNYKTPEQKWFTREDLEGRIAKDLRDLGMPDVPLPNQPETQLPDYAAWYIMENALSVITQDKNTLFKSAK